MAERRMFAKTIIDSDMFLDMPLSTQALYFHLSMRADDEGFINNPNKILRMIGASQNDMERLVTNQYVIPFDSGIVVIKHWKIHNYIQNDRFKATVYTQEKEQLAIDESKAYTRCIQNVSSMDTQVRLDKVSIDKVSSGECSINGKCENFPAELQQDIPAHTEITNTYGQHNHVKLTQEEYNTLVSDYGKDIITSYINRIDNYIEAKGIKAYDNHYETVTSWLEKDKVKKQKSHSYKLEQLTDAFGNPIPLNW